MRRSHVTVFTIEQYVLGGSILNGYKCERCGANVPEGLPICSDCIRQAGAEETEISAAEELRDIAAVLSIEAGTDTNIKQALQAILNIAARIERGRRK